MDPLPSLFFLNYEGFEWLCWLNNLEENSSIPAGACKNLYWVFADTYFYIRDGKNILTYLVYLLVNIFHFHMHPALQCV